MDWSTWLTILISAIIVSGVGAFIAKGREQNIAEGTINPLPQARLVGISRAEQQQRAAFVIEQVNALNTYPWGEQAISDRQEAERIYHGALETIFEAEGDYAKLSPAIEELKKLPIDLALTGLARIVMTLSYFRGEQFSPPGVQAALNYTTTAVNANPLSMDAWIMRLWIAATVPDRSFRALAEAALKQAQSLNPNHPYFPDAESLYYKRYGTKQQYEIALRRMIDLAPSPVVKRAGYDRLATYYASRGRLDDAIATYGRLFREYPEGSAWGWHNYSIFLMQAKRYQEALDASNRALAFFEFGVARETNNKARKALGMSLIDPPLG
jgi:tetratricopeptide (TPR) repeat protein